MSDPLEKATVGRAGVQVCRLGFGSAPLGGLLRETPEDEALDAVKGAVTAGLTYFDVAPQYGGGMAERRLGAALKNVPRDHVTVSSKVGKIVVPLSEPSIDGPGGFVGSPPHRIAYDYSYDGVLRSLEASLDRLGMHRLDIVLIHDINRKYHGEGVFVRLEEALAGACRALRRLRDEGVIGAYGSALNEVDVSMRFVNEADIDCIMLPQKLTLLNRTAAEALLPRCEQQSVKILVAGPFDSGVLATGAVEGATYNYQPASQEILGRVRRIQATCDDHAVPLRAAALQFALRFPAVASIVTGMRSRAEVNANIDAMSMPLSSAFWDAMDAATR
jgi:D-threo-aldose 1-dehydrogenase